MEDSSIVVPWSEDNALALVRPGENGGRPSCIFPSALRGMPMAVTVPGAGDAGAERAGDHPRRSLEHCFFAVHEDGTAVQWDVRSAAAPVTQQKLSQDPLLSIAVSCGGELVVIGGVENKLWFTDWVSQETPTVVFDRKGGSGAQSVAVRYKQSTAKGFFFFLDLIFGSPFTKPFSSFSTCHRTSL